MSLVKTVLQDLRANYPSNLDRDELRLTTFGLLTAVIAMTNSPSSIISQDLRQKAEASQGRTLEVPVLRKGAVTIGNARSCTFGAGETESDFIQVIWKTIAFDITMVPSNYANNEIAYQEDLAKKIREGVEALQIEIETDLDTAMDTNKSQVYNSTIVGDTYALVGNAIQVDNTTVDFFFNDFEAINFADDFYNPMIKVVANHRWMSVVTLLQNQKEMNDENTAYQFNGKDFTFSNRISNGAGVKATGYFMPDGSVGFLTRTSIDARLGHTTTDGFEWAVDTLPGLPFPVDIKYKSTCDDQSALQATGTAHLTSTKVEHWQIAVDYAILTPYNSDLATKPNAIRKFELV
jgi:hypothetical protein